jgi:hypothetical protein
VIDKHLLLQWLNGFPGVTNVETVGDGTPEYRVETTSTEAAEAIKAGLLLLDWWTGVTHGSGRIVYVPLE